MQYKMSPLDVAVSSSKILQKYYTNLLIIMLWFFFIFSAGRWTWMKVRRRRHLQPSRYCRQTQTRQQQRAPARRSLCSRWTGLQGRTGRRWSCRSFTSITVGCCPTAKTPSTSSTGQSAATLWASSTFLPSIIGGKN